MAITLTISSGVLVVEDFVPWSGIQSVTAGTSASPGIITRDSAWTVVSASGVGPPTQNRVQLSSAFQTNDLVEIYVVPGSGSVQVQVSSGSETLETGVIVADVGTYRKTTSSTWRTFARN